MALETRNGRHYFYRKRRMGARVVSKYVGSDEIAIVTAALDWCDRADRLTAQAERRAALDQRRQDEAEARALARCARALARLALLATNHHQHKGTWRKRRNPMSMAALQAAAQADAERRRASASRDTAARLADPPAEADHDALIQRCNRKDANPEDVAALRALIRARPAMAGEPIAPIRQALAAELANGGHALRRELTAAHLDQRRVELGYPHAPALERGLIDHLLLCELRLGNAERTLTVVESADTHQLAQGDYVDRRLTSAQRRYLAAVESLARVRRVRVELMRVAPDGSAEAVAVERPG